MADLVDALYYQPAKKGSVKATHNLLRIFLEQLDNAQEQFNPIIYKYITEAMQDILAEKRSDVALLLKKEGRGRRRTDEQVDFEMTIAQAIHTILPEVGYVKSQAYEVLKSSSDDFPPAIRNQLNMTDFKAIETIYNTWLPAIELDKQTRRGEDV